MYYYRGDHMKQDDENWHCFTLSRYDRESEKWNLEKVPVYHILVRGNFYGRCAPRRAASGQTRGRDHRRVPASDV